MSEKIISELNVRADYEDARGCPGQAALLRIMASKCRSDADALTTLAGYDEQALEMYRWLGTDPVEPWLKAQVRP